MKAQQTQQNHKSLGPNTKHILGQTVRYSQGVAPEVCSKLGPIACSGEIKDETPLLLLFCSVADFASSSGRRHSYDGGMPYPHLCHGADLKQDAQLDGCSCVVYPF